MNSLRRSTLAAAAALLLATTGSMDGQERVDPIPDASEQIVEALSPFSAPPDSSRVAELLEREAARSAFPTTDYDRVLVARLWRLAGETDLALAALDGAGDDPVVDLERARIWLEAGTDIEDGIVAYWAASKATDGRIRDELAGDILAVTTPEERETWATVGVGAATSEWLRDFWNERAQRMAITPDERIALHYQRLARAREWYWIPRPRFSAGWSDFYGRPEELPMDDRGMIYVRLGPPETDEGFSESMGGQIGAEFITPDEAGAGVAAEPPGLVGEDSRCWPYWRPDGYRIFCFAQTSVDQLRRADGDYKLQQVIGGLPGSRFFHRYVMNSNLPSSAKRDRLRRAGRIFSAGMRDEIEANLDDAERRAYDRQTAVGARETIRKVLESIPDAPSVASTVRLRQEVLRFLNPASASWQIWLLSSVRAGDLTGAETEAGPSTINVGGRYSVLKPDGVAVTSFPARSVPTADLAEDTGIPMRAVFTASPGTLPLTVVIEDLNAPGTGAWHQDTINVPAIGGLPQLSDIAVAQAEGGGWTRDGQTFLQVSPAHLTNPDGSIHTYFEVYGMLPGTRYEVELRLAGVDAADRIWRLEPGDLGFRLQFTSEMPGDIGRHHLRLDLSGTEPGQYVLAVRIQDEDSGAYSLPTVTDLFVAGR